MTSEKQNFNQATLKEYGTTAMNVVYGKVSQVKEILISIAEICLLRSENYRANLTASENQSALLKSGTDIFIRVLSQITDSIRKEGYNID